MTASEFVLLKLFADNPNRPLARDWLLEATSHRAADSIAGDAAALEDRAGSGASGDDPDRARDGYMFVPGDA